MVCIKKSQVILSLVLVLFVSFAFAEHLVSISGPSSINQSVSSVFNITINNTDVGAEANITQVNITLPAGLVFIANTNGTDFPYYSFFENTSNVLSWTNSTVFGKYLINGSETRYFWINLTASTPGTYSINVLTVNATGTNSTNLTLIVNDTTVPVVLSANFSSPAVNTNFSGNVLFNVSALDNVGVSKVLFNVSNSSGQVVTYLGTNSSSTNWNASFNGSAYANGFYNVTAYVNDSAGNLNNTAKVQFYLDNSAPVITLISPSNAVSSTTSSYNFTFNFTDSVFVNNCSLMFDGLAVNNTTSVSNSTTIGLYLASISVGAHNWSVNCIDSAGNRGNTTNRTLTVEEAVVEEEEESSSGGSSGPPTLFVSLSQLNNGYTRNVYEDWKFSFKVNSASHSLTIKNVVKNSSVELEVASTPQTKNMVAGEEWKVDLNSDNTYDLFVKVNGIFGTRVNLTVKSISESKVSTTSVTSPESPVADSTQTSTPVSSTEDLQDVAEESSGFSYLYWIVILVLIALAIYFFRKHVAYQKRLNRIVHYSHKK